MNDRHPSGTMTTPAPASDADPAHYAPYGTQEAQYGDFTTYGDYDATGFATGGPADAGYEADPLFGSLPAQNTGSYDTTGTYDAPGAYDTAQWSTGGHQAVHYDAYAAQQHTAYDTGAYDAAAWTADHRHPGAIPPQAADNATSGQWDTGAWHRPDQSDDPAERTQQWEWGTQAFDTGAYDTTQWDTDAADAAPHPPTGDAHAVHSDHPEHHEHLEHHEHHERQTHTEHQEQRTALPHEQQAEAPFDQQPTAAFEQFTPEDPAAADDETTATGEMPAVGLLDGQEEITPAPAPRAASRGGGRSRRRQPAKRSALLTIAVPSACVMGVAGIAAASVGTLSGGGDDKDTTASAADAQPVEPSTANSKLDTQIASLSAGADDFADRASRAQERIDLRAQQEAEKRRAAEEAARKERLRPKFALPVAQHGLSAYYGQSGVNWMSMHTGIDFPVAYGTTVMAATDGTVRTQWNSAYGNMMIVTAKDGTETWYCHLSSYRVPSGSTVKAGDPIAYSGNSGNSTGPHLHFEVRPAGGAAHDPLTWLRSHGLDPS
ncbi:M23 family metallopeptidase [Streptomyces sp. enrichment culture]|uniref:M23 family metallopeptidase n=1 Tax=Streptomyces sp. enrichment culture TaxID=1795815 RepID=UPI003F5571DB